MARYRKKPVVIEATQWFKNGDHPEDGSILIIPEDGSRPFLSEGSVVRGFRCPDVSGERRCAHCNRIMHGHGWIDTREGGHTVCPGDFIITDTRVSKDHRGYYYPCKPDVFEMTYELLEDDDILPLRDDGV